MKKNASSTPVRGMYDYENNFFLFQTRFFHKIIFRLIFFFSYACSNYYLWGTTGARCHRKNALPFRRLLSLFFSFSFLFPVRPNFALNETRVILSPGPLRTARRAANHRRIRLFRNVNGFKGPTLLIRSFVKSRARSVDAGAVKKKKTPRDELPRRSRLSLKFLHYSYYRIVPAVRDRVRWILYAATRWPPPPPPSFYDREPEPRSV